MTIELPDDETLPGSFEALDDAIYYFDMYAGANTPGAQADTFVALKNAMDSLRSFHPGYDYESGTMPWDRDDDD